jgi:hypothetical protein
VKRLPRRLIDGCPDHACIVPGCGEQAHVKGRCDSCYRYWRRHGTDRDLLNRDLEQARVERNARTFERAQEATFIRQVYRAAQHRLDEAGR